MAVSLPEPGMCNVGRAQEVITPPLGTCLAGYYHVRKGETIRDDLHVRAVVIESGGSRVALASCDLICVTGETANAAKALIEQETGIPPTHILVGATHTHTGPVVRKGAIGDVDQVWLDALPRKIADAVKRAAEGLTPATLRVGALDIHGYSFNRLFRMTDGTEVFGRRGGDAQPIDVAGPIDPQLQTLSAVDADGKLLALVVNFALHVDVIGGGSANFISADWPGEMANNIAAVYGDDCVAMLVQGTCGDINHCIHTPTNLPRGGPAKAVSLGRALAGAAMAAMERAEPMGDVPLEAMVEVVPIPYYTREDKMRAEVDALRAKEKPSVAEYYTIKRFDAWTHDGEIADVPVQVMRIGEMGLVGLPAEIFAAIGLEIKKWSPMESTFVAELANARVSTYVPTTDQAERGAYGAKPILSRWLCADGGRRMADAAMVMLHKLR